jgi:hypothetical protein
MQQTGDAGLVGTGCATDREALEWRCGGGVQVLKDFDVACEVTVVSAHRTPERMFSFASTAHTRGVKVPSSPSLNSSSSLLVLVYHLALINVVLGAKQTHWRAVRKSMTKKQAHTSKAPNDSLM